MAVVLVTGAAGFVGSAVVRVLQAQPGVQVRAGSRRGAGVAGAPGVRLDVLDPATLRPALQDVDAVVHCAVGDARTTVAGTQGVLDAASGAGVRRMVHLSSIAVYGAATGRLDEAAPLMPAGRGTTYAEWKVLAEQACAGSGVEVVRLRPTIIYGPGSTLWVETVARRIQGGHWGTFGPAGAGTCNPVHVDDVARAAAAALDAPEAGGMAFNIDGGTPMAWNDWFSQVAAAMGASLSSIFIKYQMGSIAQVFFITAGTFAAMSAWGYATRRDLTAMGSFLMMGLIGIILASVVNMFIIVFGVVG